MLRSYRSWARQLSPPWLRGPWGDALVGAIGLWFDMLSSEVLVAGEASLLASPDFAPDALSLIGAQRAIQRYPAESEATYKARVMAAWSSWPQAGTRQAVLAQLTAAGMNAELFENWQWNWDGDQANWSRFWVVIKGHPWTQWHLGDGHVLGDRRFVGGGQTWGSSASGAEVNALRQLVRAWKAAHVVCTFIVLVFDDGAGWAAAQPPDGTWGDPTRRPHQPAYIPG